MKHLECDGMSHLISQRLGRNHVKHDLLFGRVMYNGKLAIPIHMWIVTQGGTTIDYRLRMWIKVNDADLPHGMFKHKDGGPLKYEIARKMEYDRRFWTVDFESILTNPRRGLHDASASGTVGARKFGD